MLFKFRYSLSCNDRMNINSCAFEISTFRFIQGKPVAEAVGGLKDVELLKLAGHSRLEGVQLLDFQELAFLHCSLDISSFYFSFIFILSFFIFVNLFRIACFYISYIILIFYFPRYFHFICGHIEMKELSGLYLHLV